MNRPIYSERDYREDLERENAEIRAINQRLRDALVCIKVQTSATDATDREADVWGIARDALEGSFL